MKKIVKKYDYVIDMVGCVSVNDLVVEIAFVKIQNDVKLRRSEIVTLISTIVTDAIDFTMAATNTMDKISTLMKDVVTGIQSIAETKKVETKNVEATKPTTNVEPTKKPNIFKRFWNWITRKNK